MSTKSKPEETIKVEFGEEQCELNRKIIGEIKKLMSLRNLQTIEFSSCEPDAIIDLDGDGFGTVGIYGICLYDSSDEIGLLPDECATSFDDEQFDQFVDLWVNTEEEGGCGEFRSAIAQNHTSLLVKIYDALWDTINNK